MFLNPTSLGEILLGVTLATWRWRRPTCVQNHLIFDSYLEKGGNHLEMSTEKRRRCIMYAKGKNAPHLARCLNGSSARMTPWRRHIAAFSRPLFLCFPSAGRLLGAYLYWSSYLTKSLKDVQGKKDSSNVNIYTIWRQIWDNEEDIG